MSLLDEAFKLRKKGLSIFPVSNETKKPLVKWKRYKDILPTTEEITQWFSANNRSIGVATGPTSNLFLLDLDFDKHPESKDWYDEHQDKLPLTWIEKTKSDGLHYYMRWIEALNTKQCHTAGKIHPGVDTRGYGGYAKIAPSVGYEWIKSPDTTMLAYPPQWLINLLPDRNALKTPVITRSATWLVEELQSIESGNGTKGRTPTFTRVIGRLKAKGLLEEEVKMFLEPWAKKYDYDKLDYLINDQFERYPQGENYGFRSTIRGEEETKPIEIFSPTTHLNQYKRKFYGEEVLPETVSTGFPQIDRLTDGYTKGGIWIIGARPGIGKTSFCVTAAHKLLEAGKRVVFFTTETNWKAVFNRFVSVGTGIDFRKIKSGQLDSGEQAVFEQYVRKFQTYPLYIIDKAQPKSREVSETVAKLRPDVFFFDHIHRIEQLSEQRRLDINRFIVDLVNISKEYNCPGVVGSQLNRAAEYEKPRLTHLKECGALEEEAHIVILLSKLDTTGELRLLDFAKHREGLLQEMEFKFDGKSMTFEEFGYEK